MIRPFENKERIILRDYLALQRTSLANERTLFSYIRTSLYLILAGFGLIKLEGFESLIWLGYTCFVLSVVIFFFGLYRYLNLKKHLKKYYEEMNVPEN